MSQPESETDTVVTQQPVASDTSLPGEMPGRVHRDNNDLVNCGYEPALKRRFGLISIVSFSCLVLNTWGGVFQIIGVPLLNGGLAGSFWGWIIVWSGTFAIFTSLAELASIAPTSGGQYHWVSLLAPASSQKLFSYITGWLTALGWLSGVASSTYLSGTLIQALLALVKPDYDPQAWQGTLLIYAIMLLCGVMTIALGGALPFIETMLLVLYFIGFFAVIVPMVYLAPAKASAASVFLEFNNGGDWPNVGLSFLIGLQGWAFSALGADASVHMSEEVFEPALTVPRSIILSLTFNFIIGTISLLCELFVITDVQGLLGLGLQYPFTAIFMQTTGSVVGSAVMAGILIFNQVGLNITNVAAAARMLWAFARDRGVPGWRVISHVPQGLGIPVVAICVTIVFTMLISLINIGSAVALNDVLSLTIDALFGSYFVACAFLLLRRCQGRIVHQSDLYRTNSETTTGENGQQAARVGSVPEQYRLGTRPGAEGHLIWGPFYLPGWFGIAVNAYACAYMILILFFSVWPPVISPTPQTMNFAVVMFTGTSLIGVVYYAFWAKHTYEGPAVKIANS